MTDHEVFPGVYGYRWEGGGFRWRLVRLTSDRNPFPRIHLFRLPRRELTLVVGFAASGLLAARYGLSTSEGVLAAGPLVGGWVLSEVVGS